MLRSQTAYPFETRTWLVSFFNLSLHQIHILIISLLEFSKCTIRPGAIGFCIFLLLCVSLTLLLLMFLSVLLSVSLFLLLLYNMISGSKGQKVVRACTIRLLNLEPAKHEKIAIYAVNQWISNVWELWKLLCSGAIRGYQVRGKILFDPNTII